MTTPIPTIEQILSSALADDAETADSIPMTLRQLRDAVEDAVADLVDDDVPVLVRIRIADGSECVGMLDDLTRCDGGGIIIEAHWEAQQ